jgi:predicted nucleic acid-binding protein
MLGQVLAVSFQTAAELFQWAEERQWGTAARNDLDRVIGSLLVVPYDTDLARAWGRVMSLAKGAGRRLEAGDAWIAATAVHRQLTLLTHDRDLVGLSIPGLNVICYA